MSLESVMADINRFRDARNWRPNHNEKDLALSLSLEAAELLEIYQWKTPEEGNQDREHLEEEIADVLIYAFMLADNLDMDIEDIIEKKLEKNAKKYPAPESTDDSEVLGSDDTLTEQQKAAMRQATQEEADNARDEMSKIFGKKFF